MSSTEKSGLSRSTIWREPSSSSAKEETRSTPRLASPSKSSSIVITRKWKNSKEKGTHRFYPLKRLILVNSFFDLPLFLFWFVSRLTHRCCSSICVIDDGDRSLVRALDWSWRWRLMCSRWRISCFARWRTTVAALTTRCESCSPIKIENKAWLVANGDVNLYALAMLAWDEGWISDSRVVWRWRESRTFYLRRRWRLKREDDQPSNRWDQISSLFLDIFCYPFFFLLFYLFCFCFFLCCCYWVFLEGEVVWELLRVNGRLVDRWGKG